MTKLKGTIRVTSSVQSEKSRPFFDASFLPYAGRLNTQVLRLVNEDELVEFLMRLKISEDDSARWAGKAKSEGIILIPEIQVTEEQLKNNGLLK